MSELSIDAPNDLWFRNDENQKYAIIIMYSTGQTTPRFVSSMPMLRDTVVSRLEEMVQAFNEGKLICLNSHFINPRFMISIKVDLYKDKNNSFEARYNGEYYE